MSCINPVGASLKIEDCLACAGCVSVDSNALSRHARGRDFFEPASSPAPKAVIFSPQSKISLFFALSAHVFGTDLHAADNAAVRGYREFESVLTSYLKKKLGFARVLDSSSMNPLLAEMEYGRFQASMSNSATLVSSICPGIVGYIEQSATHLLGNLSRTSTPQELSAVFLRSAGGGAIVSVMPCFDKKLEADRAENEGLLDCVVSTAELHEIIGDGFLSYASRPEDVAGPEASRMEQSHPCAGSSSGGLTEYLIDRLASENAHASVEVREEANHTEYTVRGVREAPVVIAQMYGIPKITNFCVKAKDASYLSRYSYVELMACKNSCISGVAQARAAPQMANLKHPPGGERESKLYRLLSGKAGPVGSDVREALGAARARVFEDRKKKQKSYKVTW